MKDDAIREIKTTKEISMIKTTAIIQINMIKEQALEDIKNTIVTVSYLYPVYNTADDFSSGIKEWQTGTVEALIVADATTPVTWNAGWYVIKGTDVQLARGAICSGAVNLILADGAKLTASGVELQAGIQVSGTGNSLTIYGQTNQTGKLVVYGGKNAAGMGGGQYGDGSNITINGGIITATGGTQLEGMETTGGGAGIGGGFHGNGSNIIINGGKVTAFGDGEASGIGGRFNGSSSYVYVNADHIVYTGADANNTTIIDHSSIQDISGLLVNQQYVKITEPRLTAEDFSVSNNFAIYNGDAQAATVTLNIDGAGTMTVTYKQDGEAVTPINAGEYDVYAAVTAGKLYRAMDATKVGTLTIAKATLTANNFIFSAPENLDYDGNAKTAMILFDDRDGKLTGCGNITVKYNGTAQAPSASGEYAVAIDIAEGLNYSAAQGLTSDRWRFYIKVLLPTPANNQIFYQSSDHQVVTLNSTYYFDVTITDNKYDAEADLGTITFSGNVTVIGNYAFSNCSTLTAIIWPSTVTSIGGSAFQGCTNLSSIYLHEDMTSIGNYAFSGGIGLIELIFPSTITNIGVGAFSGCTELKSVTVKSGNIGQNAFNGCKNLSSIDLQEGVKSIGDRAFVGCAGMAELIIPSTMTSIGTEAFNGWTILTKLTVKAGSIGESAFVDCTNLSSIDLQTGVTSIGEGAFNGCAGMAELILPSTIKSIGESAFDGWQKLTKLTVKAGDIGVSAFQNCTKLSSIDLQEGVTSIGDYAFNGCAGMSELTPPSTVTSIGNNAFRGWQKLTKLTVKAGDIGGSAFRDCTNLSSINLQEGVTSIGGYAFAGCAGMAELILPSTMTSIGEYAFGGWQKLTKLTVKAGDIGKWAFASCMNLSSISFGNGVTSIIDHAFGGCTNVTDVTFSGVLILNEGSLNGIGTAESPANLQIPSLWMANDKPVNSTTPWHGGYFNYTQTDPIKEFLGELIEPCEDCNAVEITDGETTITLYSPKQVKFIKTEAAED